MSDIVTGDETQAYIGIGFLSEDDQWYSGCIANTPEAAIENTQNDYSLDFCYAVPVPLVKPDKIQINLVKAEYSITKISPKTASPKKGKY